MDKDKNHYDPDLDDENDDELDELDEVEEVSSSSDSSSLKDDVKDAKEKTKKAKEEYEKLRQQKLQALDQNASELSKKASSETTKQGAKQVAQESSEKLAQEGGKKATQEAGMQLAQGAGKEVAKEAGKQAAKEGAKAGAKAGAAAAAETVGAFIPYVNVAILVLEAFNAIRKIGRKIKSKITGKSEEELKEESKRKRRIILILIIAIIVVFFFGGIGGGKYIMSETVQTDIDALITRRERRYGEDFNLTRTNSSGETEHYKPLILFSAEEYDETINKSYPDDKCYVDMLKEDYSGTLNGLLLKGVNITGIAGDTPTEEENYIASGKMALKFLQAEKSNFNKVFWIKYSNNSSYDYTKSGTYTSEADMAANDQKATLVRSTQESGSVKMQNGVFGSLLNVPNLTEYDILPGASEEEKAMVYINMLSPYMQKWIIPFAILVDTEGDKTFANYVLNDMAHEVKANLYELNQETKTTNKYYYLQIEQTWHWDVMVEKTTTWESESTNANGETVTHTHTRTSTSTYTEDNKHKLDEVTNSRDHKPGTSVSGSSSDVSQWAYVPADHSSGDTDYEYYIDNVYLEYTLKAGPVVALDNGEPMVQEITVSRTIEPYRYVPKLSYVEDFYNILSAEYSIIPIAETNAPSTTNGANLGGVELYDEENGIGLVSFEETWQESFNIISSKTETYKVSYYTEEDYENIGRRISRVEWKQDWGNVIKADGSDISDTSISLGGGSGTGGGMTATKQALFEWIVPLAKQLQKETGLLPSLTIAQKIQESGWDWTDSIIETEGHNYWGMKCGSHWTGDYLILNTKEDDGTGNLYEIQDAFRKYESDEAGFSGRGDFFWSNSRYRNVLLACFDLDWEAAVEDFKTNGYATDIKYANSLQLIIQQNELYQYDNDPEYQFDGTIPDYADYNPYTGEIFGGDGSSSGGIGVNTVPGAEFETDPIYSELKNNPIYPEKTAAELVSAFRKYSGSHGYSYDDLYFAFSQIDEYYPDSANPSLGGATQLSNLKIPDGGFGWPVEITDSNPGVKVINCLYGYTEGYGTSHNGVDISRGDLLYKEGNLSRGPNIVATHDGEVVYASANPTSDEDSYTYIQIKTTDGAYITEYGHLSEIHVAVGDTVTKGQVIGVMGNTGNSTGVHLHYVIYNTANGGKERLDPLDFYELTPEYGSIDRATITGIPTGYEYKGSKTGYLGGNYSGDHDVMVTTAGTFPRYRQGSGEVWSNVTYGGGTMSTSACGPTSMAIILSGLGLVIPGYDGSTLNGYTSPANNIMEPTETAKYCRDVGCMTSQGMAHSYPGKVMSNFGIETITLERGSAATVLSYLEQGYVAMASTSTGFFTGGGHIIAIPGTDGNGNIAVIDPNKAERDGFYTVDQMNGVAPMPAGIGSGGRTNSNVKKWWVFKIN